MKKFLILLFTLSSLVSYSQFVTGFATYPGTHDYRANEITTLKYKNTSITVNVDSIKDSDIEDLLIKSGVHKDSIICALGRGSSISNKVEFWFAYKGRQARHTEFTYVINNKHTYGAYAYNNWITGSIYRMIDTAKINRAVNKIADDFTVYSFYVEMNDSLFIEKVLSKLPVNGNLANMRWTPYSSKFIERFKLLNWKIIQYNEAEVTSNFKNVWRPKAGW